VSLSTPHAREQITLELVPLPSYVFWFQPPSPIWRQFSFLHPPPSLSCSFFRSLDLAITLSLSYRCIFVSVWRRPSEHASVRAVRLPSRLPLRPRLQPTRHTHRL
jgi:hypothetical protein